MVVVEFLSNLSVILASLVAIGGISTWKREYFGKRRAELAEDILLHFYKARDAIEMIRNPLGHSLEGQSRKQQDGEDEREKNARNGAYVVFERYERVELTFQEMELLRYKAYVVFGELAKQPFESVFKQLNRVFNAARALSFHWAQDVRHDPEEDRKRHRETVREEESYFWRGLVKPDPVDATIDAAIHQIELVCIPYIRPLHTGDWLWFTKTRFSKWCFRAKDLVGKLKKQVNH